MQVLMHTCAYVPAHMRVYTRECVYAHAPGLQAREHVRPYTLVSAEHVGRARIMRRCGKGCMHLHRPTYRQPPFSPAPKNNLPAQKQSFFPGLPLTSSPSPGPGLPLTSSPSPDPGLPHPSTFIQGQPPARAPCLPQPPRLSPFFVPFSPLLGLCCKCPPHPTATPHSLCPFLSSSTPLLRTGPPTNTLPCFPPAPLSHLQRPTHLLGPPRLPADPRCLCCQADLLHQDPTL